MEVFRWFGQENAPPISLRRKGGRRIANAIDAPPRDVAYPLYTKATPINHTLNSLGTRKPNTPRIPNPIFARSFTMWRGLIFHGMDDCPIWLYTILSGVQSVPQQIAH